MASKSSVTLLHLQRYVSSILRLVFSYSIAAWLAQLDKSLSAKREASGSNPGRTNTQGFQNNWGESATFVQRLDFLIFSAKDDKPEAPSDSPSSHKILWDVKVPTHCSLRVGEVVPGVVVYLKLTF